MEKYVKARMDVIEFDAEDVITASGCSSDCSSNLNFCSADAPDDGNDDMW